MKVIPLVSLLLGLTAVGSFAYSIYSEAQQKGYLSPAWKQLSASDFANTCPIENVTIINGNVVLGAETLSVWNTAKSDIAPYRIQESTETFSACQDQSGGIAVLCKLKDTIAVVRKQNNRWETLSVPPPVAEKPESYRLASDESTLALVSPLHKYIFIESTWNELKDNEQKSDPPTKVKSDIRLPDGEVSGLVLDSQNIYESIARGEWGGEVNSINLKTGKRKKLYFDHNVSSLGKAKNGKIWFISQQFAGSSLYSLDGDAHLESKIVGLKFPAINRIFQALEGKFPPGAIERVNWPFEPTEFLGIKCLDDGSVMVATRDYGLMNYKGGEWERVSSFWPDNLYLSLCGLEITPEHIAVMPVYRRGLIFYDLKNKSYRFWVAPALLNGHAN